MAGLSDKRLVVVTGKGGVGKSTVAAALALLSSRAGKKTLVCELNADHERVSSLLGKPAAGPDVRELEPNLWAVDVRPDVAMKEYVLMTLKFERVYKTVFENKLVKYFLRFIPSLQELVLLGKVLHHVREKDKSGRYRFDQVILDAPATGHAITFLRVPQVLLDTVPPGPVANDATWMRDLLVDPATSAAVLVTLPEEMPVNETLELAQALRAQVKLQPAAVVLNQCLADRFTPADVQALAGEPALQARVSAQLGRQELLHTSEAALAKLSLPLARVPRLFVDPLRREQVQTVADALRASYMGAA